MTLTFGSLFAGVGGFDLGFESAGYECRFQVEWDSHCQQTLAHHWPDVPRWGDVSTVNGADLPPVDVITYGFPCQDLSVAGKRAGLDGQRSHLFFEAVRIITEMREATNGRYPTWAVAENVAGLLNADGGSAMARVVDELAAAGAVVIEWATLDAQWFGVPQRRRRVFIASCFDPATSDRCPDPLFPVGKSSSGHPETGQQARQNAATDTGTGAAFGASSFGGFTEDVSCLRATNARESMLIADTVGPLTPKSMTLRGSETTDSGHVIPQKVTGTLAAGAHPGSYNGQDAYNDMLIPFVKVVRSGARDEDGNLPPEVWREEHTNPTLTQFDQGDTRTTTAVVQPMPTHDVVGTLQNRFPGTNHEGIRDGQLIPMVAQPRVIAPTLTATNDPSRSPQSSEITQQVAAIIEATTQPDLAVRRLTPIECERLMGWPDNHTLNRADGKINADSTRYKQCGNGVASPVAAWIAKHLANTLTQ